MNKVHSIKSINKACDILEAFLGNSGGLSLTDMAEISGINKPTAARIVSNLVARGYLVQKQKRGKYTLGMIFFNFSGAIKREIKLRDIASPYLIKLSDKLDESICISYGNIYEGIMTETFHGQKQGNKALKVIPDEGSGLPLHCSSAGKIYLAELSNEELDKFFTLNPPKRFTRNTILDPYVLKNQLAIVKQEGIAYDEEEYSLGVRSVGAGIRNNDGIIVGAIAVIAPSPRLFSPKMKEIGLTIKDYAMEISSELGYTLTH